MKLGAHLSLSLSHRMSVIFNSLIGRSANIITCPPGESAGLPSGTSPAAVSSSKRSRRAIRARSRSRRDRRCSALHFLLRMPVTYASTRYREARPTAASSSAAFFPTPFVFAGRGEGQRVHLNTCCPAIPGKRRDSRKSLDD